MKIFSLINSLFHRQPTPNGDRGQSPSKAPFTRAAPAGPIGAREPRNVLQRPLHIKPDEKPLTPLQNRQIGVLLRDARIHIQLLQNDARKMARVVDGGKPQTQGTRAAVGTAAQPNMSHPADGRYRFPTPKTGASDRTAPFTRTVKSAWL